MDVGVIEVEHEVGNVDDSGQQVSQFLVCQSVGKSIQKEVVDVVVSQVEQRSQMSQLELSDKVEILGSQKSVFVLQKCRLDVLILSKQNKTEQESQQFFLGHHFEVDREGVAQIQLLAVDQFSKSTEEERDSFVGDS